MLDVYQSGPILEKCIFSGKMPLSKEQKGNQKGHLSYNFSDTLATDYIFKQRKYFLGKNTLLGVNFNVVYLWFRKVRE